VTYRGRPKLATASPATILPLVSRENDGTTRTNNAANGDALVIYIEVSE
jgi:hypothetical protein